MDLLYPHCAAIDVHKRTAVVSVCWVDAEGQRQKATRTYSTMTQDIRRLASWLSEKGVTHVAMESTGVYWKPLFNLLEAHFTVVLANATHVKAVPGRKTDVRDSEWLLDLMQHGLIRGSFIPPAEIRALRDLTRYRTSLVEERARQANRIQKVLEDANIKLAAVATDTLGVSGRQMLAAIATGEADPQVLAALAKGQLRRKHDALVEALDGLVHTQHQFLLRELLSHITYLDEAIARVNTEIEQQSQPVAAALKLLCSIKGIKQRAAENIVAEIGVDMSRFPSAAHLCSWAAICPGNHESAGKQRSGRTRKGNRWLRRALVQAAWLAIRDKDSYLAAQFRRIAKRRGEKRAIIAVAHSLLTSIYYMLQRGTVYGDLGAAYFDRLEQRDRTQYYVRQLTQLGYAVQIEPQSVA